MKQTAARLIRKLRLQPHPEGGYFRETYRCREGLPAGALPARYQGRRSFSTAIYFLLTRDRPSGLHRLKSDELWHFYRGAAVDVSMMGKGGHKEVVRLGRSGPFQLVIPAGTWFSARTRGDYTLVGCTVAPGFDFADFELASSPPATAPRSKRSKRTG